MNGTLALTAGCYGAIAGCIYIYRGVFLILDLFFCVRILFTTGAACIFYSGMIGDVNTGNGKVELANVGVKAGAFEVCSMSSCAFASFR